MIAAINLWDPTHVTVTIDLLTAFLLGLVHGITPDEHTWPITFSYAIGGYSTWRGMRAGLIFSLAFMAQQALASQLAHLGLAGWFTFRGLDGIVYIVVGLVMLSAGLFVMGRGVLPHLHIPGCSLDHGENPPPRDLKPWMPAVHGFVAGWGIDAFSVIIYTTLAPAMPLAAIGWLPGFSWKPAFSSVPRSQAALVCKVSRKSWLPAMSSSAFSAAMVIVGGRAFEKR